MPEVYELKHNARNLMLDLQQMKTFCENPVIMNRAEGVYLWDIDGKRYLDGISGIYVVNIGHGDQHVIEAIRQQQQRVFFVAPLHAVSDTTVEYSIRLAEILPDDLSTLKLLSGGSEATESAMKFARQYHRQNGNHDKYKFISLYKGFHGATLGAMSASGLAGPRKNVFGPFLEGFVHIPPPTCFRCPYDLTYPGCDCFCAQMLEKVIESEGPQSVAGFLIEPISNTGGIVVPPPDYLPTIRDICTRYNVLLIFDEIITGMGRTGDWFAAHTFGTTPDILCAGKGLSSGYAPLSVMAVRDELYFSTFWGEEEENIHFATGHTYGGNPISAAAGLAVIEVVEQDNLIDRGKQIGAHLRQRLEREVAELEVLGEIRGKGCMACVEFVEDMETQRPFAESRRFGKRVEKRLVADGLLLRCDPNWISFAPPLITTTEQADEMVDVFLKCVRDELDEN